MKETPRYECTCVKCNKSFFASSKRALICLSCKAPTPEDITSDQYFDTISDVVEANPITLGVHRRADK
jgi:hypothetical protein